MGAPTLAEAYRRFGEIDSAFSPLYAHVAVALSESEDALRAIEAAPARRRRPALVLAALHDLALAGRAPALALAYADGDPGAAAAAAIQTLTQLREEVVALVVRHPNATHDTGPAAVLHPAVAEAAHRLAAGSVGLVDLGSAAGHNLHVDRVSVTYGAGRAAGDPTSPVRLSVAVRGDRAVPTRAIPPVTARIGLGDRRWDASDADDARWLRACLWPDQRERRTELEAEIALVAAHPPLILRGHPVDLLLRAMAQVPADALAVVLTTWALSRLTPGVRLRLRERLTEAAAVRPLAWVSVEGVGVAPGVPTLGDRPASGHSIIGLTLLDGSARASEALGRCWSRGRTMAWLADTS